MTDTVLDLMDKERKRCRISLLHVEKKTSVTLPDINSWARKELSLRLQNMKKRKKQQQALDTVQEETVYSKMQEIVKARNPSQKPETGDRRLSCVRHSVGRIHPPPTQANTLYFDPSSLCGTNRSVGITDESKKVFEKSPEDRGTEDIKFLKDILLRLPVFAKYPVSVLQELAGLLRYVRCEDGQVVLKQDGRPNKQIYFLLSGAVDLITDGALRSDKESHQKVVAGPTCGELALNIRDSDQAITTVCKGTAEFLTLRRPDFDRTLRVQWEDLFRKRYRFLRSCEFFRTWTDQQLYSCADLSSFRDYDDQEVILGNTNIEPAYLYFLVSGTCDIVRHMELERRQSPYLRPKLTTPQDLGSRERFLDKPYGRQLRVLRDETHYLSVGILKQGDYFGIGEDLLGTYIMSRSRTTCILVSASMVRLLGKSTELQNARELRNYALPSKKKMYKSLQESILWNAYRHRVVKEIVSKKRRTQKPQVTYEDVPRSFREEPRIPQHMILKATRSVLRCM